MRRALLIALPAVFLACAAMAAPNPEDAPAQAWQSAPESGQAVAAPSPCSGCAGHDCANCPLARAALARAETLPPCPH
ncbi:hypothetical protein [Methylosinus sp. Sm6]|uniref:hypothetical protein n=1 Tax=Methylosinus sp. Sm6 TaxID=2866948 RepID=UPI001C994885|nr:hypothetical protein [Methylosinus sp. Sm6]MBY6243459.1 hypothetical protein [Methylosinus sp. Sm6]